MARQNVYIIAIDVPEGETALELFEFFRSGGSPSGLCTGELPPSGSAERVKVEIAGESGSVGVLVNRDDQAIPITVTAPGGGGAGAWDSGAFGVGPIRKLYINTDSTAEFGSYGAATLLVTMTDRRD